jgi:hypothetical protein
MMKLFSSRLATLATVAMLAAVWFASQADAFETCCGPEEGPSWIFATSTYTNDPMTGARVAQYERKTPVEPLEDERNVTSGYRRTRTVLRGADGSNDTYYQVQNWGNGRGGLDAEWERVNDAWQEAYTTGGSYSSQGGPYGYGYGNQGYGYGGPGYGNGGWGPGNGGPGYGGPGWGNGNGPGPGNWNGPQGGWGGPGNNGNGPGWNGPGNGPNFPPHGGGPSNQSQQGNWQHHGWGQGNGGQDGQGNG